MGSGSLRFAFVAATLRFVVCVVWAGLAVRCIDAQRGPAVDVPAHGVAVNLLEGSTLKEFDTLLKGRVLNSDPEGDFTVKDGVLHVSGKEFGYVVTKETYSRFYLRAEFKWGEGTYGERAGKARDSGILYCVQGEPKVWPRSLEFQIQEGETGDFWLTDGAALTGRNGKRLMGPAGSAVNIGHNDKGPETNVTGFRNTRGELEEPFGEWNLLELVEEVYSVRQYVNGHLANVGTDPFPKEGKILFQSEGSEIYIRNLQVAPLK